MELKPKLIALNRESGCLAPGDHVTVSLEEAPVQPIDRRVDADGKLLLWNGAMIPVSGLTEEQASEAVRIYFVTNGYPRLYCGAKVVRLR